MGNRDKILNDIECSKSKIHCSISEIGHIIHKKTNIASAIKTHPFKALGISSVAGFALAMVYTPVGRVLLKSIIGSVVATASAHYSKKGLDYLNIKGKYLS